MFNYLGELLLRPGNMVISSPDLGRSMLEISARTTELPNGSIIDNADSIAFAAARKSIGEDGNQVPTEGIGF